MNLQLGGGIKQLYERVVSYLCAFSIERVVSQDTACYYDQYLAVVSQSRATLMVERNEGRWLRG